MMLISRTPDSASCKVRGIGVAVRVSTCTSALSCFSFSFCATPKCCSSSTMTRPRCAKRTSFASSACVPTTISILPVGEIGLDLLRLLGGDHARQLRDAQRQPGKTLGETAVMLAREQGGRDDHRDLTAAERRDKGGAQRHLGLAETDIAADQPVHRLARRHVGQRVLDRAQLVVGLGIREAGGEFLVDPLGRGHRLAGAQLALGGDADQLAGDLADALLDPRLARLPADPAEPVERSPACPPSRSATTPRCSRPARTAGRRRHRAPSGNHAARRRRRSSPAPRSGRCRARHGRRDRRATGWPPR